MLINCCLQANEMARRVLADAETSEGDLAPAPKLLEIILQNCRARVDHCVTPYLQVGGTVHRFWCWLLILWVSSGCIAAPDGWRTCVAPYTCVWLQRASHKQALVVVHTVMSSPPA